MSKIGIMGGTFNPIHCAHLILAESAYEELGLDKVYFMPCKKPPHKLNENIIGDEHRVEMIKLAIQNNPHFILSCLELEREGITYTADTLKELTNDYPQDEFYFIMGADSLFHIEEWYNIEQIFQLSIIVAAIRDHASYEAIKAQIKHLKDHFNARIHLLHTPNMDISSKMIRQYIKEGKSIRYYVPDPIFDYISSHSLYKETKENNLEKVLR
ncbi:MAG: putative nicotinate-nucleotide adenylyltransferase [Lachnoclostridium sp.]|jgi:nicotinate-nucleotide adenylyltransferase